MSGFEWARPTGVWALLAPLVLLVLLRLFNRPPERVTGTLALWREVTEGVPRSARSVRRSIPLWGWLCALALFFGGLALAGPRRDGAVPPVRWRVVIDPSPSMGLPWKDAAEPAADGRTRGEVALARAVSWLRSNVQEQDRVHWVSPGREPRNAGTDEPPAGWLAPRPFAGAPDWELFDEPGTLFVTDRAPTSDHAGVFASGGAAVPGAVGVAGMALVEWDGAVLRTAAGVLQPGEVELVEPPGTSLPVVLRRLVEVWAEVRGFRLVAELGDGADRERLQIELVAGVGPVASTRVERDGWSSVAGFRTGLGAGPAQPSDTWLTTPAGEALVRASPGTVRLALIELAEPEGDPAAFALSWGRLFDRWRLPPTNVVPLEERADAGPAVTRPPGFQPSEEGAAAAADEVDAWLAALAGVLALAGLSLRR